MNKSSFAIKRLMLGGVLAAVCAPLAFAQGQLNGFTTAKVGGGVQVKINGQNLKQPKIIRVMNGQSFILEFDASFGGKATTQKVGHSGVESVAAGWFKNQPPKTRVHLKVDPTSKIKVQEDASGWFVNVNVSETTRTTNRLPDAAVPRVVASANAGLPPVPPLTPINTGSANNPKNPAPKTASSGGAPKTGGTAAAAIARRVSLDFVNTDVVQILKALAMQAGVNIVTSPDVKGQLTVSMGNVTIDEALELVTTLSSLRYGKVGNTFVVTSSANFSETMRKMNGDMGEAFETRVVPIYSGEGTQIKAAVLKSVPMHVGVGTVEIVLPSEEVTVEKRETVSEAGGEAQGTTVQTKTGDNKKDPYVVLIGPASRLDTFEHTVRTIDNQICMALGIDRPSSSAMVRNVYRPNGHTAAGLLQAITGSKDENVYRAKIGSVDVFATPTSSVSDQVIVLHGRETEVNQILENLRSIDQIGDSRGDYLIYDVKHLDPRSLREELLVQVPGLSVNIPPASAGNPNLFVNSAITQEVNQRMGTSVSGSTETVAGGAGRDTNVTLAADQGQVSGIALPYSQMERSAHPMKLVLRGTKDQIQRAVTYLQVIDVAPRQVALELRVMELTREDALRVGLDWNLLTGGTVRTIGVNQGLGGPGIAGQLGFAGGGVLDVTATLDQLATRNNLIARPNLLAIDGRETELFVGEVIRYVEQVQAAQQGTTVITNQVPVGVRLAVLPRIGGDGSITMDLRPVVSSLTGFLSVPGGGRLPQTSLRVAQSTMHIQSGETIAIGGLIQDQDRQTVGGIPILKDLPIIGALFRRTETSRHRSEVVFFLTARVVDQNNRATAADPRAQPEPGVITDRVGN
jgi:type II secretory pathway component GspD/PulD (secretin)